MFEIQNVGAVPELWNKSKYPMKELEVGQGFNADVLDGDTMAAMRNRLSVLAVNSGKRLGRKFSVRKVGNVVWVIRTA